MKQALLFLALLAPLFAFARLGEAITECDARYGGGKPGLVSAEDRIKPMVTGPNTTNLTYMYKGFTVRVGFRNSVAVRLDISQSGMSKMTPAQIEQILEANKGANPWYETNPDRVAGLVADSASFAKSDRDVKAWRRFDETVAILYNKGRSMRLFLSEAEPGAGPGNRHDKKVVPQKPSTTF